MLMPTRAKIDDYVGGKKDEAGEAGDDAAVAALARQNRSPRSRKQPLYYTDIAEKFAQLRFHHHRPRHRPSARHGKAVAGLARPVVRARLGVRGEAAKK